MLRSQYRQLIETETEQKNGYGSAANFAHSRAVDK